MCQLSRHRYIASGATTPLFLLHEYREYSVQGTAWVAVDGSRKIFVFIWFHSIPSLSVTGPNPPTTLQLPTHGCPQGSSAAHLASLNCRTVVQLLKVFAFSETYFLDYTFVTMATGTINWLPSHTRMCRYLFNWTRTPHQHWCGICVEWNGMSGWMWL